MSLDPWMLWAIVGLVSGCVLGLAGAGGGIIAIPILIYWGGYSVKAASGYGLLVISVGAILTWLPQRKYTNYSVVLILLVFSFLGSYISAPWKAASPDWALIILLNFASLFSLYSLWIMRLPAPTALEKHTFLHSVSHSSLGGVLTGILSTMTGLGGGIIMVPWLTSINRLNLSRSVACSLLTIALSAPYSAYVQGYLNLPTPNLVALGAGALVASLTIKGLTASVDSNSAAHLLDVLRKLTLTTVILISMVSTLIRLI
ncbi:Sulfite exporter TauE/SafE family protein [Candidatus Bealeia paramacronuclearis]|uniref:Probable membrane transporter protein n=1 Tax=Candidatus Bealeia paramacronuclearis TaxID=1921001 RepID=A0ABZ2C460_9PROT|nr:Sulfite exporter TauE/SafE family protein [Candidatus Bealeia paramacronuclearis]